MRGHKVITAEEMRRIEQLGLAAGANEETFMERAGNGIAHAVEQILIHPSRQSQVSLLIGKGNKGGDALVAGTHLLKKGYKVTAYLLTNRENCSPLAQKMAKRFEQMGGFFYPFKKQIFLSGFVIDGLLGTGFRGQAEGLFAEAIALANYAKLPILSIDIPSGLNASTGEVATVAIQATWTVTLGLPKIGFYIGKGWDHIGQLSVLDFGLPSDCIAQATPQAYLFADNEAKKLLPKIKRSRHKYERGYLLALAGSLEMPGAALLACHAALRAGAGIVRLFHPPLMATDRAPKELICEEWKEAHFFEECKRAASVVIGPGLGRTEEIFQILQKLLSKLSLPTVLDADALFYLSLHPQNLLPDRTILTPHHGEMQALLHASSTLENCQSYVEKQKAILVLKGAPTIIFQSGEKPLIVARGDPGMATAGAGDVLTGIIGALLAQKVEPYVAAALGVFLHALAGELAASQKTSYSVIASDLIEALPSVFRSLRN